MHTLIVEAGQTTNNAGFHATGAFLVSAATTKNQKPRDSGLHTEITDMKNRLRPCIYIFPETVISNSETEDVWETTAPQTANLATDVKGVRRNITPVSATRKGHVPNRTSSKQQTSTSLKRRRNRTPQF
jgi:hypothetical protein